MNCHYSTVFRAKDRRKVANTSFVATEKRIVRFWCFRNRSEKSDNLV